MHRHDDPHTPDPRPSGHEPATGGRRSFNAEAVRLLRMLIARGHYESPEKIEAAIDKMRWSRAA